MHLENADHLINELSIRLPDYLISILGQKANAKVFPCYVHDDTHPSMSYTRNNEVVHCFACGAAHNIFNAAEYLEGYPSGGKDFFLVTLPALAKKFDLPVSFSEATEEDKALAQLKGFVQDLADAFEELGEVPEAYLESRQWSSEHLVIRSISQNTLMQHLKQYYSYEYLLSTGLVKKGTSATFGEDKITFLIKDHRKQPVGFIARNLESMPKYVNSPDTPFYKKSKVLLGLDTALTKAKKEGLYIVEGPGDLAALHWFKITNAAATCGIAFTEDHYTLLNVLGIKDITLAFDWDEAGAKSTYRTLHELFLNNHSINIYVLTNPIDNSKDISDYLKNNSFEDLRKIHAFEWMVKYHAENKNPNETATEMVQIISAEKNAIRREQLIRILSDITGISTFAITQEVEKEDVSQSEDLVHKIQEISTKKIKTIKDDPSNAIAHISDLQDTIELLYREKNVDTIGPYYQVKKFESLRLEREAQQKNKDSEGFICSIFGNFFDALNNGQDYTEGTLAYVPGRANSGKTIFTIAYGCDVLVSDPNAIVVMHFTDDNYKKVEPRIKSNLAVCLNKLNIPSIYFFNHPYKITNSAYLETYNQIHSIFKSLLEREKLVIIDAEEGNNLVVLERNLKYLRNKYPDKKLLVISDCTHNYEDFSELSKNDKMERIAKTQKKLTVKYKCFMMATAEYRKSGNKPDKLVLPTNEDIADARALEYAADLILHIYNDLNDRGPQATIYRLNQNERLPRVLGIIGKNKISAFKNILVFDIDPTTVSIKPSSTQSVTLE